MLTPQNPQPTRNPNQQSAPLNIASLSPDSATRSRQGRPSMAASAPYKNVSLQDSPDTYADPCEACRKALSTCVLSDDEDNSCVPCRANGSECSLIRSPQPRKRKLDDESSEESTGRRSPPGASTDGRRLNQPASLPSTFGSTSFLDEMANSGGPTQLSRTLGLQNDRYSQYIGATTDFEPSLINLSPFDPQDESLLARGTLRKVGVNDTFLLLPDSNTPGYDHTTQDVDDIERIVAPHGRRLIDLYFDVVHPSFPILQKGVFYEKYDRSHREFSPALLAAVYIISINWWEHCEELAALPRPNVRGLERLMRSTLADAMFRPKLSTVQAGLLLSQRPEGDQWAPTAQLVAIGQELGLHLDCTNWKIPPWEKGLRKRLAWALYMQDKWGALAHGRPSHIFSPNWAVKPLTSNDFPDVEWDEENPRSKLEIDEGRTVFRRMVQLTEILAEILETFYTISAMQAVADVGARGALHVLELAKPIQLKLKDWQQALPLSVRIDPFANPTPGLPSVGYLHLAYFAAEITLHRRIIRSFEDATNAAKASKPSMVPDAMALHMCRRAAKSRLISAMDFVNRLSSDHLSAFWYFASKTNFALIGTFGSLMWATSPNREEADWYRYRLSEYRWTLSVSAKPVFPKGVDARARAGDEAKGLTGFAMGMLDISTGLLKKLPEKPELSAASSVADMASLGYIYGSSTSLYSCSPSAPVRFGGGIGGIGSVGGIGISGSDGGALSDGGGLYMSMGSSMANGGAGGGGNIWSDLKTLVENGTMTPDSMSEVDSEEDDDDEDDDMNDDEGR